MVDKNTNELDKRKLIVSALDKNIFVEAGAGAGKTTLIVSRIINQLKSGMLPREIVAITFTNAASRELKERIVAEVHKESHDAKLKEALDTIDQMQISTIHSFCNRLLRERSLDADMPLEPNVLEEEELTKLKDESFLHYAEGLAKADWDVLLKAGKYKRSVLERLRSITDQVIEASDDVNFVVSLPDVSESTFLSTVTPYIAHVSKKMIYDANYTYIVNATSIEQIPDDILTSYGKRLREALLNQDELEIMKILVDVPDTVSYIIKNPSQKYLIENNRADKKNAKEQVSIYVEELQKLRSYIESSLSTLNTVVGGYENLLNRPYLEYAKKAADYFFSKLPQGVLYNDLLIQKTDKMLRTSKEAREYFSRKFKCIYVDEFQDTDHVQERLIRNLCKSPSGDSLRDGALFVVGDPKQSIYRFRGAEPEVYFACKSDMAAMDNAIVLELSDNYRSNEKIIEWVNKEYATKEITPGNTYIPMNAVKKLPASLITDELIAGVYIVEHPIISADATAETDAVNVKDLILNLVNGNHLIADYDNNGNPYTRKIKYSDFLIMCTYMPGMDVYADVLREYGIPFVMDSKTDLSTIAALKSFVKMYEFLANPYLRENRVAVMEALQTAGMNETQAAKTIHQIHKDSEGMSDRGKLIFLKENISLMLNMSEEYSEAEMLDLTTKIVQMSESVLSSVSGNAIALSNALNEYVSSKLEHQLILDDNMDAVRFMNLHKAKGLEGNIVIWANRQENAVFRDGAYQEGTNIYPSITYNVKGRDVLAWKGHNRDESVRLRAEMADMAEKIRLEYVACTRTKQALIFMDKLGKSGHSLFTEDYELGSLPSVSAIIEENENKQPTAAVSEVMLDIVKGNTASESCKEATFVSHSPSEFEDESAGNPMEGEGIKGKLKRPRGGVFGTVMHRSIELLVNRITLTKQQMDAAGLDPIKIIDACFRQAIAENVTDIPKAELNDYETFIHEVLMAYGKWWYAQKMPEKIAKAYTELPFSFFYEDSTEGKVWMHGTADLVLLMKDNSYLIIDYKSDVDEKYPDEKSFEERIRGKYIGQIDAYKKSISNVMSTDASNIKAQIVSFSQKDVPNGEKLRVRVTDMQ